MLSSILEGNGCGFGRSITSPGIATADLQNLSKSTEIQGKPGCYRWRVLNRMKVVKSDSLS